MNEITVELGERSYPVFTGIGILSALGEICRNRNIPPRLAIVTDKNVASLYLHQLSNSLRHHGFDVVEIVIGVGERQKSLTCVNKIVTQLVEARLTRDSGILAFGGGVVGDVAGFVAATYRRGVPLVQIPTTRLAQVESSIGGKVAVNHPLSKNAVGAFLQPKFVFSDVNLLSTLPKREIICGLGEVLKYGIIDVGMFSFLDEHLDEILRYDIDILQETVLRCNALKAPMIAEDEKETNPAGGRAVLNLGHAIGHALENLSSYKLHHGEAVLVGLEWELEIAREAQLIEKEEYQRILALLKRVNFKPDLKFLKRNMLLNTIIGKNGKPKFVLARKIGEVAIGAEIDSSIVGTILKERS